MTGDEAAVSRAFFFDVDGTLTSFGRGASRATVDALLTLKKKGNRIFICSGRSRCQLPADVLRAIPFDGFICSSGAYVECDGAGLFQDTLDTGRLRELIAFLYENDAEQQLQSRTMNYHMPSRDPEFRRLLPPEMEEERRRIMRDVSAAEVLRGEGLPFGEIEKIFYVNCRIAVQEVAARFSADFEVTYGSIMENDPSMGEVTSKGITKELGMRKLLDHCGISREDTVAFGDGPNDAEMITFANTGIVMGNGLPEVKAIADYVTASVDEDGVAKALQHFGWI